MEFPIKMTVLLIIILATALVIIIMVFNMAGGTQGNIGNLFDFFGGMLGGKNPIK